MNKKMVRDIVILAVIAVVAIVAYQFYSVGNRVKKEAGAPASAPPPSATEGMPPSDAIHGGAGMEAFQQQDKVFNEEMNRALKEASIEKNENYKKTGVVATVNGEGIPAEEFERRLASRKTMTGEGSPHGGTSADDKSAKDALLDKMVEESLIRQEAARRGITVTEEEIEAELKVRMQGFPSEAAFNEALKAHNFTIQDIRGQLAREMLLDKLKAAMTQDAAAPEQPAEQPAP